MKEDILDNILTFKNNLDLQLEDLELESNGIHIDLYFDTSDIYQAVLGMEAFYTLREDFDVNKFKDERALVHSLVVSGWLGEVQLAPPHQTEFLAQMNLLAIDTDPKESARRFLNDLGLTDIESFRQTDFERLSTDQFYNFIKR